MHGNAKTPLEEDISRHFMERSDQNHQKRGLKGKKHGHFAYGGKNVDSKGQSL